MTYSIHNLAVTRQKVYGFVPDWRVELAIDNPLSQLRWLALPRRGSCRIE